MRKEVLSVRLKPSLIKWVEDTAKKHEIKNSEVISMLIKDQIASIDINLSSKAHKASIKSLRILEQYIQQKVSNFDEILRPALDIYREDIGLASNTERPITVEAS